MTTLRIEHTTFPLRDFQQTKLTSRLPAGKQLTVTRCYATSLSVPLIINNRDGANTIRATVCSQFTAARTQLMITTKPRDPTPGYLIGLRLTYIQLLANRYSTLLHDEGNGGGSRRGINLCMSTVAPVTYGIDVVKGCNEHR